MKGLILSSGRELFASDASLFVDDAEAYEQYQRDEENQQEAAVSPPKQNAKVFIPFNHLLCAFYDSILLLIWSHKQIHSILNLYGQTII